MVAGSAQDCSVVRNPVAVSTDYLWCFEPLEIEVSLFLLRLTCPENDIRDIQVLRTFVNGKMVFDSTNR